MQRLFLLLLLASAQGELTQKKIQTYLDITEKVMSFTHGLHRQVCPAHSETTLDLMAGYLNGRYSSFKNASAQPSQDPALQWFMLVNQLCLEVDALLASTVYSEWSKGHPCVRKTEDNLHVEIFESIPPDTLSARLKLFEHFLDETSTFVRPAMESGHKYLIKKSNFTGPDLTKCLDKTYPWNEYNINTAKTTLDTMKLEVVNATLALSTGLVNGKEKEGVLSLLHLMDMALLFNCEYAGRPGFGSIEENLIRIEKCSEGENVNSFTFL